VISVELSEQVTSLVYESEFLSVTGEHDLCDIDTEKLFLLCLALAVEENVVDSSLFTAHDCLLSIFIKVRRLILHVDLLLEFQILLAEDEDLPLTGDIYIVLGSNSREHFHSLRLAADRCNEVQVI